ncbi:MAG TPA: amidohydrolase family protein, partial [Mucilaginibacter sp.]|nr:amidohydrolase family protein [Mucilaginibacter sp.]
MKKILPLLLLLGVVSCKQKEFNADLLVKNALVYTVDSAFTTADAFVVSGGKIIAVGSADTLEEKYRARQVVDAEGKPVYPGFIDAHTHFYEYGLGLQEAELENTKSWQEVVDSVRSFAERNPDGWIIGRGWDQNKWAVKQFPNKAKLDSLFPARPVLLSRIDGHAIMVNQAALNIAGVKPGQTIIGGTIETVNGKLTGMMI